MKRFFLLFTFLGLTILYSCLKDKGAIPLQVSASKCDSLAVTYSLTIAPIISAKCATPGCHVSGGAGNGIFTSYTGVKEKVENGSFNSRVFVSGDMPPSGPLPDDEQEKIKCWLNAGAPNN